MFEQFVLARVHLQLELICYNSEFDQRSFALINKSEVSFLN